MDKTLNIMYAADDRYAPFLGVSIQSLLENNKNIDRIRFFCALDHVSDDNKKRLQDMIASYGMDLVIIDGSRISDYAQQLGIPKYRGSYTTHFRKFFESFIPDDADRLLYLDSDTIVQGDLSDLLTFDFGGRCLAVVYDALGQKYKKHWVSLTMICILMRA